jgi:hypothetical protein
MRHICEDDLTGVKSIFNGKCLIPLVRAQGFEPWTY